MNSREGPHEAHRRMVLSLQRQQMMDTGSQIQHQQRESSFELGQRRPKTQGNDGQKFRGQKGNPILMVSTPKTQASLIIFPLIQDKKAQSSSNFAAELPISGYEADEALSSMVNAASGVLAESTPQMPLY